MDSDSVASRDSETSSCTSQSLSDETEEPIKIIFKSSLDGSETPMECPPLAELRNMIPKLAIQVRPTIICSK
jgi:hypothetical protein